MDFNASTSVPSELFRAKDFPMPFSQFMRQALYSPHGYYHQDRAIIGKQGDFITAPEISSIFSQCLANAILSSLASTTQGLESYYLLELGAGNGTMACDMLSHWYQQGKLPYRYQILELSGALKRQQQKKFNQLPEAIQQRIEWIESLPSAQKRVIIANEVIDALPCDIGMLKYKDSQWWWCEHLVDYKKGSLQWLCANLTSVLPSEIEPEYCVSDRVMEIPKHFQSWLYALRQTVSEGVFMIIDYADYDKALQRTHPHGTLRCYQSHHVHCNPFIAIGEQDITYHVNVDVLATQLEKSGWQLGAIETQANFLLNNGLQQVDIHAMSDNQRWEVANQIQQLTSPGSMGERYKVMQCF